MAQQDLDNGPKTHDKPRAEVLIQQYQQLKGARSNFESYWQSLHDYFYIEADDISRMSAPGSELNSNVLFDATTLDAGDVLASGFMNYLTPPTSKWFGLRARNPDYKGNKKISSHMESIVDEVNYALNRSNFYNQIIASYKGSGVYGTSVLLEEETTSGSIPYLSRTSASSRMAVDVFVPITSNLNTPPNKPPAALVGTASPPRCNKKSTLPMPVRRNTPSCCTLLTVTAGTSRRPTARTSPSRPAGSTSRAK